jgi:hypothetical protein
MIDIMISRVIFLILKRGQLKPTQVRGAVDPIRNPARIAREWNPKWREGNVTWCMVVINQDKIN